MDQSTKERLSETLANINLQDDDGSDRMVIALDFGTTYSGIAYAFSSKPEEVHCIQEWPGSSKTVPKSPTVLKYTSKNNFKWGYELDRTVEEKIVGIKLLLDPQQKRPLFDTAGAAATKAEIAKLGKPPADIASDYIAAIYKHALKVISGKVPKAYLDMLDKYFVLSVPAVWSDKAKDTTLRAARNAGISPVELIKEPEAAAMYTLHYLKHQGLELGDAITICDAGGGTVDLVSYEILNLHPLELKELCPSTGGIAGSLMINKRFENWVKDMVGERVYLDLKETDAYRRAMKDFDENIKPSFQGTGDETAYVNFPMAKIKDNPSKGIAGNTLTLTTNDLREIFQPVFEEIDKLVAQQVNEVRIKRMSLNHPKGAAIKAIFLVGGFGESLFLKESLIANHTGTQVIQPNGAWSAIVKGAALSKLPHQVAVLSSVAERHYGVTCRALYDEKEDQGRKKIWDSYEGIYRVEKMTWFISKFDDLERDRTIPFSFYRTFDLEMSSDDYQIDENLEMCSTDVAPVYPTSAIHNNCKLHVDLSNVSKDQFKKVSGSSKNYLKLNYKLLVRIEGARMAFSFECGGKEYASIKADFGK
ncbi:actin-like ATPase domain-containing protein [Cenococcum geophilum 1.58]|uniref:actin-like ATPase domain-containing protein n=1 Tax=Cenococcum geophilum 1.58 TaxID=794803 RepID=UPI00358DE167|nr:actin-like ATPase domain-containing protein [Cenococcum geophilum 1.58]